MKIRAKFMVALAVISVLFFLTGSIGLWHLSMGAKRLEKIAERQFAALKVTNDLIILSTELESAYLPEFNDRESIDDISPATFRRYQDRYRNSLEKLKDLTQETVTGRDNASSILRIETAVANYLSRFSQLFDPGFRSLSSLERQELKDSILMTGYAMIKLTDEVVRLYEKAVTRESARAANSSKSTLRFLIVIMGVSGVIACFLYREVIDKFIRPVEALTQSARLVEKQNFELTLPVTGSDEIGELTSAFNDMSTELQIMKMQSDHELLQLNLERKAIIEGFPYPIFILNQEGQINQINPEAESLLRDLKVDEILPGKVGDSVNQSIITESDYLPEDVAEAILLRRGSKEYWYLPRIFQLHKEKESFEGWAVVLVDVSKVRWMSDVKTDLIATMSHEVRTPITSIRMALHLLSEEKIGDLNETQASMVESAKGDCERLLRDVNELLRITKLDQKT
ncbi:MAG: histidine kinase dimerization/phospho-acceptor domain-containing protein [Verrucomicrobiales bacterium]|nr:histidine kinase dimerization/phospho-acceptor domain-containing protein [Verrucomicrobiales bacterium]